MIFKDILNMNSDKLDIFFGYNDNDLIKSNLINNPSILITGSTGTSKSVMLNQILLQLINKNRNDEIKLVTINPTKVELKPYRLTNYSLNSNVELETHTFDGILEIIQKRLTLFKENSVNNFDEYNNLDYKKLPRIVIAIDEATFLFKEENSDEKLRWIINNCNTAGIILIITTNDIYNDFFSKGYNTLMSIRISFDFVTNEDAKMTNLANCDKLGLNEFLIEINNEFSQKKYKTFYFDEEIVNNVLNK